ncbi:MAG: hypothetical protein IKN73_03120 [Alphaproteobacteria bacterium]|nr:hypothetical protein [Alphaproteobacteria bacterium]
MSNNVVIDFYEIKHNKNLLNDLIRQKKLQKHYSTQTTKQNIVKDFNQAKEQIKQKIISLDKTEDNSLTYTAMANFKKTNE